MEALEKRVELIEQQVWGNVENSYFIRRDIATLQSGIAQVRQQIELPEQLAQVRQQIELPEHLANSPIETDFRATLMKVELEVQQMSEDWSRFCDIGMQHRVEQLESNQDLHLEALRNSLFNEIRRAVHSEVSTVFGIYRASLSGSQPMFPYSFGQACSEDDFLKAENGVDPPAIEKDIRLKTAAVPTNEGIEFRSGINDSPLFTAQSVTPPGFPQAGVDPAYKVDSSRWNVFRQYSLGSLDMLLWYDHRQLWTQSILNTLSTDDLKDNILALAQSYVVFGSLMLGIGAAGLGQGTDGTATSVAIFCLFGLFCMINLWLTVINVVLTILVSSVDPLNLRFWCKGNVTMMDMVGWLVVMDINTVEAIFILLPIYCLRKVEPPIVQTFIVWANAFLILCGHIILGFVVNTAARMTTHSGCQSRRRLIDDDWVIVSDFADNEAQLAGMSLIRSDGFTLLSSKEYTEHIEQPAFPRSNAATKQHDHDAITYFQIRR